MASASMGFNLKSESKFWSTEWINGLLLGLFGVLILSIVILSSVPPVSKDALVHHLAVPKLFLEHGGIHEIPSMPFSYYPMNLDLLYMIPLYFGQDIIPKFMHFSFALLTTWLIFRYIKARANHTYGLLGAIFFLSVPIIIKLSITVYVDLGVIFFSTASLLSLFQWMENGFRVRSLILSAILCGLAMGTKYNGLITFFLMTLLVLFVYTKHARNEKRRFVKPLGYAALFSLLALIVFSPWMIRNHQWKGNPVHPLYNNWFQPKKNVPKEVVVQKVPEGRANRGLFTYRRMIFKERWWEMAMLPVRIFFQGRDGDPQYFDGKLNPFLFFLPFFAFFVKKKESPAQNNGELQSIRDVDQVRWEKRILLIFALLFFLLSLFTRDFRIRYVSPIIPALVILSIFGLKNIQESVSKWSTKTALKAGYLGLCLLVFSPLIMNANYLVHQFRKVEPLQYIKGDLSRDAYISKHRPEYPALQYINHHLPEDVLILFVFIGKRGYYSNRQYVVSGESRIRRLLEKADSPDEILSGLKRRGFTHLFICNPIFIKWVDQNFEDGKKKILRDLFNKHIKTLYQENGFSISIIEYPLT